ncbi:hypothetical protein L484_011977 [Morus notabilis]|uniref:Uncharacterized protein n=1 Tax=Morus notabilis TaxID=981085 RepID=W9RGT8_9ROSA|nr:hypothetical protein L484_011977 [Morus notabilis]
MDGGNTCRRRRPNPFPKQRICSPRPILTKNEKNRDRICSPASPRSNLTGESGESRKNEAERKEEEEEEEAARVGEGEGEWVWTERSGGPPVD